MTQLSFFNTTREQGEVLQSCVMAAKNQDDLVLEAYRIKRRLTPSDCWHYLIRTGKIDSTTPLTSCRRSITTLTKRDLLRNTEVKKIGIFGRPENIWQII